MGETRVFTLMETWLQWWEICEGLIFWWRALKRYIMSKKNTRKDRLKLYWTMMCRHDPKLWGFRCNIDINAMASIFDSNMDPNCRWDGFVFAQFLLFSFSFSDFFWESHSLFKPLSPACHTSWVWVTLWSRSTSSVMLVVTLALAGHSIKCELLAKQKKETQTNACKQKHGGFPRKITPEKKWWRIPTHGWGRGTSIWYAPKWDSVWIRGGQKRTEI